MNILVCNVGSTSLKYKLYAMHAGETALAWGRMERVGAPMGEWLHENAAGEAWTKQMPIPDYATGISCMLDALNSDAAGSVDCVAFKVVHARGVTGVRWLDEETLEAMEAFNTVAPSHNPPYLAAIRQFALHMPDTPLIGSFETGFHASMPEKAALYSIPIEVSRRYAIRRYGFHGASHEYITERVCMLEGRRDRKLISCHLGGSGSLCAVVNGKSVDTSLGFSLQCGVMHNNRCGDIDPYVLIYLMKDCGYSLERIETMLNRQSGLLGMSGVSNDLRDVERAADAGNADARIAMESYAYQIQKLIGAYAAAMGGVDAIAFAGGIGENSPTIRRMSLAGLSFMGVTLDEEKNAACTGESEISVGTGARIYVINTNEERIVAQKAYALLMARNA